MSELPWLDPQRFPQRQYLRNPGVVLQQTSAAVGLATTQTAAVTRQWLALLGLDPESTAVFGSESDAIAVGLPVAPGDVVLLSAPVRATVMPRFLHAGACYVDVGRSVDGQPDVGAWRLALQAHPDAWVYVSADQSADSDWPAALEAGARPERTLLHAGCGLAGLQRFQPEIWPLVTWLALRDPSQLGSALLWAAVSPGAGQVLVRMRGPLELPHAVVQRAETVLAGLRDAPQSVLWATRALDQRAAVLAAAIADWPGALLWPAAGASQRLVRCMAGDAAALADRLAPQGWVCPHVAAGSVGDFLLVDLAEDWLPPFHASGIV